MVTLATALKDGHHVPISAIPDSGYFRAENAYYDDTLKRSVVTGYVYGVKLFHNECRARVRLEGGQTHVVFGQGDERREFESGGASEVNWPTTLSVIAVTDAQYEAYHAQQQAFSRRTNQGGIMAMTEAQLKALKAKYQFAKNALAAEQAKGDAADEGKLETLGNRVEQVQQAAIDAGVDLNSLESAAGPATQITTVKGGKATTKPGAPKAKLTKAPAGSKQKTEPKVKKEKKLPATGPCICCGKGETAGSFLPGHDARTKGWLYKVERGEMELDELPAGVRTLIKMAGRKATAGKDDSDYRVVQSPVKFPGRDDVKIVDRDGNPKA